MGAALPRPSYRDQTRLQGRSGARAEILADPNGVKVETSCHRFGAAAWITQGQVAYINLFL